MLHFIPDKAGPYEAVARYLDRLAPGSYLVISHGVANDTVQAERIENLYRERDYADAVGRGMAGIERFFAGTELVEPGLVRAPEWHPESPDDVPADVHARPETALIAVGVGRKP
jgi:hypothetical protein